MNQLTHHGRFDHEKDAATELAESAPRWIAWAPIVWRRGRAFYQRRKAGQQIENLVHLRPLEFRVYIPAADKGKIYFNFFVANFGRAIVEADRVIMRGITIGTRQIEADSEMLRVDGAASPGTIGIVAFAVDLRAPEIRDLVEGIGVAPNLWSSPSADVRANGAIVFTTPKKSFRLAFDFHVSSVKVFVATGVGEVVEV